jgi:hypothetical protein
MVLVTGCLPKQVTLFVKCEPNQLLQEVPFFRIHNVAKTIWTEYRLRLAFSGCERFDRFTSCTMVESSYHSRNHM